MRITEIKKLSALAKEIDIIIEIIEDGRTIRLNVNAALSISDQERALDRELEDFDRKHV